MDFTAPIATYMTRKLIAVAPTDKLAHVKAIFDEHRIHHLPVVHYTTLVGIISKTDLHHFMRGILTSDNDKLIEQSRLEYYTAGDIMTTGIATLSSNERINVALQVFLENLFHAIPVVDNGELVGMLTTFDIVKALSDEDNARIKGV
jgi:acetoin utilization protein AcuB